MILLDSATRTEYFEETLNGIDSVSQRLIWFDIDLNFPGNFRTIPFERTFRDLDSRPAGGAGEDNFNFCGCGW